MLVVAVCALGAAPSGVTTKVITVGTGKTHPGPNDCVKVRYKAWTPAGALAGNSGADGATARECMRTVAPGIAEALANMVVGETRRAWIPEALAFPVTKDDDDVPAHRSDLTYELTLVEIVAAP